MPRVVLLGPQRSAPTLPAALAGAGVDGPVAVITAGWEDREDETEELARAVDLPLVNLRLWHAAETAFGRDPELLEAWRRRRLLLREQQATYRVRLTAEVETLRALHRRRGPDEVLSWQEAELLDAIRTLDDRHHARMTDLQASFQADWTPAARPALAAHAERMAEQIHGAAAVLVAGGHVGVLLGRIRLFDLAAGVATRPVFAWAGGGMITAERICLFHDSPPQGVGHAEIMGPGLGLVPDVVLLPDAHRRLRLTDPFRVGLLARRLAPRAALLLEEPSGVAWDGARWEAVGPGAERLTPAGGVEDAFAP